MQESVPVAAGGCGRSRLSGQAQQGTNRAPDAQKVSQMDDFRYPAEAAIADGFMAYGLLQRVPGAANRSCVTPSRYSIAGCRNPSPRQPGAIEMSLPFWRREDRRRRLTLLAVLALAAFFGSRDILDEGSGMPMGDMPRYLMNGVFLHDLVASGGAWSVDDLVHQAELYYARYPALSLGHHPPLLYVSLVPFYALSGISVFSARLASLAFFLLATWGFYALTRRIAGQRPAVWGTLLFVTNLFVVRFGQYTLAEVPMLALVLVAITPSSCFLYMPSFYG
jgi:hypothetical protein